MTILSGTTDVQCLIISNRKTIKVNNFNQQVELHSIFLILSNYSVFCCLFLFVSSLFYSCYFCLLRLCLNIHFQKKNKSVQNNSISSGPSKNRKLIILVMKLFV